MATGAHERVVPFPGWTLPGVIGLAAATVMLKSHGVAPGSRVVVAGCGPLLLAVAAGLAKAGVAIEAVADLSPRAAWMRALPSLAGRPTLAMRGAGWLARTLLAGVPLLPAMPSGGPKETPASSGSRSAPSTPSVHRSADRNGRSRSMRSSSAMG